MLACYMAKRGHDVEVYERRQDMRKIQMSAGKSINLALSVRGWTALERIGMKEAIEEIAIPMYAREIHNIGEEAITQPYGQDGEAIYSVSRGDLNKKLMNKAEETLGPKIFFDHRLLDVDFDKNTCLFQDTNTGEHQIVKSDFIFGTDGAFSGVRNAMVKTPRFNYSQSYLKTAYKELTIPPAEDGSHRITKNVLHIWPRRHFMLIALPNMDGSFTVTLFAPYTGEGGFEGLDNDQAIIDYFNKYFPSAVPHMPTLVQDFYENPTADLVTVKCDPWTYENAMLLGDAAHAVVPFYGQGMNAGFEDCRVLDDMMEKYGDDWEKVFEGYNESRVDDGQAIADLAIENYTEMCDSVADQEFILRKKIEKHLVRELGGRYLPKYETVSFSNRRYSHAIAMGKLQDQLFDQILNLEGIESNWQDEKVLDIVKQWLADHPEYDHA